MKIALAQINTHVGNFIHNREKIVEFISRARLEEAELIVFPELSISGYPPRDFLDFDDFTTRCLDEVMEIARYSQDIGIIVGTPVFNKSGKGKMLHNAALLLSEGEIVQQVNKALLPNYDIFDEYRYFEPENEFKVIEFKGLRIALTICEDLWNIEGNYLYKSDPMEQLALQKPDIALNIAASPFNYTQSEKRKEVLAYHALKYKIPVAYVNIVGAQTELIFDGESQVLSADGKIIAKAAKFKEDIIVFDTKKENREVNLQPENRQGDIQEAIITGIREYFRKLGFSKAILGLSGGIDSALVTVLAARALGAENVMALMLPSRFSSNHSVDDSLKLLENTGVKGEIVSIEKMFSATLETLDPYFKGLPFNIAEENIQARLRAVLLMAYSNKFGHILLNTSNKSEAAVGYGTLYGDMCGGLSVIGDLYKTQVYELCQYINRDSEIIPWNIINKAPSAELRPDQKDSDSLPEYEILDKILFHYIEEFRSPEDIVSKGYKRELVERICRMVNLNEYKRFQAPPILRISPKAFGSGRRLPIEARYLL